MRVAGRGPADFRGRTPVEAKRRGPPPDSRIKATCCRIVGSTLGEAATLESSEKMTHAVRLVVPSLVLALGFGTACLFRRPLASRPEIPASSDRPATFTHARRGSTEGLPMQVPGGRNRLDGPPGGGVSDPTTAVAPPSEEKTPSQPRGIAPEAAGDARSQAPGSGRGQDRGQGQGDVRRRGVDAGGLGCRHRVVDGDSLRTLAARYLGDAGRADEIYQANRKRLSHPDALPIGLTLEIPPP